MFLRTKEQRDGVYAGDDMYFKLPVEICFKARKHILKKVFRFLIKGGLKKERVYWREIVLIGRIQTSKIKGSVFRGDMNSEGYSGGYALLE